MPASSLGKCPGRNIFPGREDDDDGEDNAVVVCFPTDPFTIAESYNMSTVELYSNKETSVLRRYNCETFGRASISSWLARKRTKSSSYKLTVSLAGTITVSIL